MSCPLTLVKWIRTVKRVSQVKWRTGVEWCVWVEDRSLSIVKARVGGFERNSKVDWAKQDVLVIRDVWTEHSFEVL